MNWTLLLTGLGLALFIEGAAYALIPDSIRRHLIAMLEQPVAKLRWLGLTLAAIGVAMVWLVNKP
ncbi:DUF2065 domain-containing protein [Kordiimonas marina]|uniref:DUF2065 domain-containing protein n=1 Tax=Kordiimonas marina TaxID=2872312 RepID=UPI0031B9E560|nr:DUF2065 domain-containing protein [Kordiimonas marina]